MSRIGNKTITIPAGVEITVASGNEVTVKGPKGTLTRQFAPMLGINVEGAECHVTRPDEKKATKQLHGTTRALLNNMVVGVSQGFEKKLELIGIGFRCAIQGNELVLNVGYSHQCKFELWEDVKVVCDKQKNGTPLIIVSGIDKQRVGEFAANVRAARKPEPYKGKGIRYEGEYVRRKEGKTAGKK